MLDVIVHKELNKTRPEQSRRVFYCLFIGGLNGTTDREVRPLAVGSLCCKFNPYVETARFAGVISVIVGMY